MNTVKNPGKGLAQIFDKIPGVEGGQRCLGKISRGYTILHFYYQVF